MAFSLNRIESLGSPFQVVHQQTVDVAPGASHPVQNDVRKLLFVLSGECRHRVVGWDGAWGDVSLRPGDILALPHRCEQRYAGVEPNAACRLHVIRLSFDPEALAPRTLGAPPDAPVPGNDSDLLTWAAFGLREIRCLHAAGDPVITETVLHLRTELERRLPGYRLRAHALCAGLLLLFARTGLAASSESPRGVTAGAAPGESGYHVGKIKQYLRKRLHLQTRLSDVSAFVGLSEEHIARLFKSATGITVLEYVRRLRIAEAKSLLAATDDNLSEIARRTGFASLTVFSRNFTRETGVTPSEFRRQIARQIG
jgi:AraC-like DNA-binding protein